MWIGLVLALIIEFCMLDDENESWHPHQRVMSLTSMSHGTQLLSSSSARVVTHWCVWRDLCMWVPWLIDVSDMTHVCGCHDSLLSPSITRVVTHWCVWHPLCMWVPWLIDVSDMTRWCGCHDSFSLSSSSSARWREWVMAPTRVLWLFIVSDMTSSAFSMTRMSHGTQLLWSSSGFWVPWLILVIRTRWSEMNSHAYLYSNDPHPLLSSSPIYD